MSVRLYVGDKPAYTFLSTQSAQEFVESQSEAVRKMWPMEIRITRDRKEAPDGVTGPPSRPGPLSDVRSLGLVPRPLSNVPDLGPWTSDLGPRGTSDLGPQTRSESRGRRHPPGSRERTGGAGRRRPGLITRSRFQYRLPARIAPKEGRYKVHRSPFTVRGWDWSVERRTAAQERSDYDGSRVLGPGQPARRVRVGGAHRRALDDGA